MTLFRADGHAFSAQRAFFRTEQQFGLKGLRFRIMTPEAMQRTSFEEHDGPDARPVMHRELFDIEDESRLIHVQISASTVSVSMNRIV